MRLNEALTEIPGLKYIAESMELISAPAKKRLRELRFMTDAVEINDTLDRLAIFGKEIEKADKKTIGRLENILMRLHDISTSLDRLKKGETLDDIELFEVKSLAFLELETNNLPENFAKNTIALPDLTEVRKILDPDSLGTPFFYIYDSYDNRIAELRKKLKETEIQSDAYTGIYAELNREEEKIRKNLAERLRPFADNMEKTLLGLCEADLLLAKTKLNSKLGLQRPEIIEEDFCEWKNLVNPEIEDHLEKKGKRYQPVSFTARKGVSLVTGANMGGKTVLLKTMALGQSMAQFGFYVPAETSRLTPVDHIMLSTGDRQSETNGLSSFGAEMMRINEALAIARSSKRSLILIDEPARTTNPEEGKAITSAIIEIFSTLNSITVITSHYSGLSCQRRFRVKGLSEKVLPERCRPSDLSDLMDYSITEAGGDKIPHEALRVARLMGTDEEIIKTAQKFYMQGDSYKEPILN